jgi:hypothetical protein
MDEAEQVIPREDLFAHFGGEPSLENIPDRFRVDFSTPLEYTLERMGLFGPLLSFVFLPAWFFEPLMVFAGFLGGVLLFGGLLANFLYWTTDNFYIFDRNEKRIFYHFQFLFRKRINPVADFAQVLAVTVASQPSAGDDLPSNLHSIALVISQDQVVPLSDQKRNSLKIMTQDAQMLAEILGVPFIPGMENAASRFLTLPDRKIQILPAKVQSNLGEILFAIAVFAIAGAVYFQRFPLHWVF